MTAKELTRVSEVLKLQKELAAAIERAAPDDAAAWRDISATAGAIQRRTRLLGGLGRGG